VGAAWAVDACALAGCALLVARGQSTIDDGGTAMLAVIGLAAVAATTIAAVVARTAPPRLAPVYLAVLLPGLMRSDRATLTVIAFAACALLPAAALYAVDPPRTRRIGIALVGAAALTAVARVAFRDPFRELRCEPACVDNPWLIARAPGGVRFTEVLVACVALVWVAIGSSRWRRRSVTASVATSFVLAATAVWSARLLVQPRPAPGDTIDRAVLFGLVGAVAVAAGVRLDSMIGVTVARSRITRFARSLGKTGELATITEHLRRATGDPGLEVDLGADHAARPPAVTTSVVRGAEVVATIHHRPAAHDRVAAAVTPAIALALETELLVERARIQLVELQRSRATAVLAADDARRRLERNLHDGAQQRLLVVGMRLAHAATAPGGRDSRWGDAAAEVAAALRDVRRIGRGDAAIIAELGLDDAVASLADSVDVQMAVTSTRCADSAHDCWPQDTATTAYRLLTAAVAEAERCGAHELSTELACLGAGAGRTVATAHDGRGGIERGAEHDRVLASGGRIVTDRRTTPPAFEVWLP
jgi:signal transduction histidine kinase